MYIYTTDWHEYVVLMISKTDVTLFNVISFIHMQREGTIVKSEDTSSLYMTLRIPVALSFNVAKALAVNRCTKIGSSLIAGKIQSFSLT